MSIFINLTLVRDYPGSSENGVNHCNPFPFSDNHMLNLTIISLELISYVIQITITFLCCFIFFTAEGRVLSMPSLRARSPGLIFPPCEIGELARRKNLSSLRLSELCCRRLARACCLATYQSTTQAASLCNTKRGYALINYVMTQRTAVVK